MFQKIIATILIIGLILSLNFNLFLVKPKQAQAGDWIGGPFQIIDTIKQSVLDPITSFASKPFGKIVLFELRKLLRGEFSDANKPLAILDWSQFINERINRGSAKFIGEFNQVFDTSDPFQRGMKSALTNLGFNILHKDLDPYSRYARPTLKDDLEAAGIDYDAFVNSGYSLVQGGWAGWFSMIKPQNNIFGQILMAERARRTAEEAEAEAARPSAGVPSLF
ncbi:MAG: hypothetical protein ACE5GI_09565, partial [Candidatus Aminicenantales bacterium]